MIETLHGSFLKAAVAVAFAASLGVADGRAAGYAPLVLPAGWAARRLDLTVWDAARNRKIPIRVYLPAAERAPMVLFSHGLGGTTES